MKPVFSVIIIVSFFIFMTGCQISEEDAIEAAKNVFFESFSTSEVVEANFAGEQVDLYLPRGMEVTEEIDFNVQLERNEQIFLLFFIPFEPWDSEVHLVRDQEFESNATVLEVVEEGDKRGYLVITPAEDGQYKVIVGIGGAKITTISTVANLAESTEMMAGILHTVQYKE
ncbi:hypothetical protein BTR23_06840 [Alkalihalophilus pseudofirmus]|nr:hypothetical protein BTR23_06840 [Alkalihalophilus pseudofirmus]